MLNKYSAIIYQSFRFIVTGVIAVTVHYGIYLILHIRMADTIAYTIGYFVSFVCNFMLTCVFTFHRRATIHRSIGFCIAHIINFCLQICLLKLYLWLGVKPELAPLSVFCITVPANFLLVRYVFIARNNTM